ncbi:divergent polysaccharide deacetylase family protein [Woodsholea maritima]|uniref:divergent polysaccharide deacetylase family protein n=1 Tax=Woodsholea maritima TaxID=240237 RepID=UPI00039AD768|nr:divergent polysaccharide deacetylase family protein [Woodsholea maritima]
MAAGLLMLVGAGILSNDEETYFGRQVSRERPIEVASAPIPEYERRSANPPIWQAEMQTRVREAYLSATEDLPEPSPARQVSPQIDPLVPSLGEAQSVRVAEVVPIDPPVLQNALSDVAVSQDAALQDDEPLGGAEPDLPVVSVEREAVPEARPVLTASPSAQRPRLAIIIDDLGIDNAGSRDALALDPAVTLSILPYPDNAPNLAQQAQARGFETFVHLPMQPEGLDDPGPNAIMIDLPDEEITRRVEWAFSRVPGAIGFNNHMGSLVTQNPAVLRPVFEPLAGRDLYFIDSVTSSDSVAGDVARGMGFETLSRDVFLDHDPSPEAVRAQVREAIALAKRQGYAIAIGHPHPETLNALFDIRGQAAREGVDLVPISRLFNPPVANQGT